MLIRSWPELDGRGLGPRRRRPVEGVERVPDRHRDAGEDRHVAQCPGAGFSGPELLDEIESHGVTVVVDPFSAPYLRGSTVDFLTSIQEAGFKIDNPNVVGACGCGHSFQVEEGEAPADTGHGCGSGCAH